MQNPRSSLADVVAVVVADVVAVVVVVADIVFVVAVARVSLLRPLRNPLGLSWASPKSVVDRA